MTLPLRKKHLTTAKSIRRKTTVTKWQSEKGSDPLNGSGFHCVDNRAIEGQPPFRTATKAGAKSWLSSAFKTALLGGCSLYAAASISSVAMAQQPGWQPTRVPSQSDARPLAASSQGANNQASQSNGPRSAGAKNAGEGTVVLRWKSVTNGPAPVSATPVNSPETFDRPANELPSGKLANSGMRAVQPAAAQSNDSSNRAIRNASGWTANPLRNEQVTRNAGVRPANYQQQTGSDPFGDSRPALPGGELPSLPPSNSPTLPSTQLPQDPLSNIEPPPLPGNEEVQPEPVSPIPNSPQSDLDPSPVDRVPQKSDPFGDREKDADADKAMDESSDEEDKREDLKMPKRKKNANTNSCNDMRERVRKMRLSDISLDVSPEYGEGLRTKDADAKERLDFAASAPIRDWRDYTGTIVATGRLINLRDDRVVLDLNGREQTVPLRDLSDIDIAYVADAWNLPLKCGIGYEAYAGRQFIPSAVEWKASGLCHKPLYFEDVQLERYGHEVGPVLQPLISSAHFFGNMLILPYKMGIHPPGECQYSLGYYRPGNCAPYMIQPFPFSLRGAAAQAGFVSGAFALVP